MTVDRSLKVKGKMVRARNVLKREERLIAMGLEGRWKPGDSIFGLPKIRVLDANTLRRPFKSVFGEEAEGQGANEA